MTARDDTTAGTDPERPTEENSVRAVLAAGAAGTVLEWYYFALYGIAAALVFNQLFFPTFDSTVGQLAAFATFAVGSFVRPLGGIVLGHLGDRFGRKPVLVLAVTLMGASTVLIGCLPTYGSIGAWAPILLLVLRIVQAFGAGAEQVHAIIWSDHVGDRVTPPQYALLCVLALRPGIDQAAAGELASLDKSSTADVVARLVRRGLVESGKDTVDRRRKVLTIPHQAARLLREVTPTVRTVQAHLLAVLSPEEQRRLTQMLHAVAYTR